MAQVMYGDSSSNDSFVWTTASHESSDSDSIVNKNNTGVENTTQNEMKVDFTDQKLKKSWKNSIDIHSTQKENLKMDGRNDTDERKKLKIKYSISENNISTTDCTDESYLNMKIKHEEDSVNYGTPKKSKKKKKQKTIEENDTDLKKKRKSSLDMSDYENDLNIKAKYEEDTVTEETPKKSKKKKKHKKNSISNNADDYEPENINNHFFKAEQTFDQNSESESHANYLDMKVKQEKNNFTEPLSVKSKKKKSKIKINDGPDPDFQSDCSTFGEGCLDMKVKQEENGFAESTPLKRKKKKSHTETNGEIKKSKQNDVDTSYDSESEYKSQKKNKKSATENWSMSEAKRDTLNSSNVTNTSLLKTSSSYVLDKALKQKQPETETQKHKTKKITQDSSHISSSSDDDHDKNNETAEPVSTITHRSPPAKRIPDRLTFENDDETDDEQIQTNESSLLPTRVQRILIGNTNLTPILEKPSNVPVITQDDDIWILKLPSEINVQALVNKEFILDRQCKIKLNSGAYYGTVEDESNRIAVMSCEQDKFVIRNLSSSGIIKFRKRIPRIHLQDDNLTNQTPSNFIPLPETKCRHPLFGPNFKRAMKIPKHVTQRLKSSQLETSHPNEPKKKKKHKKAKEEPMETVPEEPILEPDVVKKKAKKRKHTDDIEGSHKKTKRIKYNPESTDAWDTEKAVEENLFNF